MNTKYFVGTMNTYQEENDYRSWCLKPDDRRDFILKLPMRKIRIIPLPVLHSSFKYLYSCQLNHEKQEITYRRYKAIENARYENIVTPDDEENEYNINKVTDGSNFDPDHMSLKDESKEYLGGVSKIDTSSKVSDIISEKLSSIHDNSRLLKISSSREYDGPFENTLQGQTNDLDAASLNSKNNSSDGSNINFENVRLRQGIQQGSDLKITSFKVSEKEIFINPSEEIAKKSLEIYSSEKFVKEEPLMQLSQDDITELFNKDKLQKISSEKTDVPTDDRIDKNREEDEEVFLEAIDFPSDFLKPQSSDHSAEPFSSHGIDGDNLISNSGINGIFPPIGDSLDGGGDNLFKPPFLTSKKVKKCETCDVYLFTCCKYECTVDNLCTYSSALENRCQDYEKILKTYCTRLTASKIIIKHLQEKNNQLLQKINTHERRKKRHQIGPCLPTYEKLLIKAEKLETRKRHAKEKTDLIVSSDHKITTTDTGKDKSDITSENLVEEKTDVIITDKELETLFRETKEMEEILKKEDYLSDEKVTKLLESVDYDKESVSFVPVQLDEKAVSHMEQPAKKESEELRGIEKMISVKDEVKTSEDHLPELLQESEVKEEIVFQEEVSEETKGKAEESVSETAIHLETQIPSSEIMIQKDVEKQVIDSVMPSILKLDVLEEERTEIDKGEDIKKVPETESKVEILLEKVASEKSIPIMEDMIGEEKNDADDFLPYKVLEKDEKPIELEIDIKELVTEVEELSKEAEELGIEVKELVTEVEELRQEAGFKEVVSEGMELVEEIEKIVKVDEKTEEIDSEVKELTTKLEESFIGAEVLVPEGIELVAKVEDIKAETIELDVLVKEIEKDVSEVKEVDTDVTLKKEDIEVKKSVTEEILVKEVEELVIEVKKVSIEKLDIESKELEFKITAEEEEEDIGVKASISNFEEIETVDDKVYTREEKLDTEMKEIREKTEVHLEIDELDAKSEQIDKGSEESVREAEDFKKVDVEAIVLDAEISKFETEVGELDAVVKELVTEDKEKYIEVEESVEKIEDIEKEADDLGLKSGESITEIEKIDLRIEELDMEVKEFVTEDNEFGAKVQKSVIDIDHIEKEINQLSMELEEIEKVERLDTEDTEVKEVEELHIEIEEPVTEVGDIEKDIEIVEEVERLDAEVKEDEELPIKIEEPVTEVGDIEKEIEIVEEVERLDTEVKEDEKLPIKIEEPVTEVGDIEKDIEIVEEVKRLDTEVKEDEELPIHIEESVSEVGDIEKEIEIVEEVERLNAEVKEDEELPIKIEEAVTEVGDIEKEIEIVEKVDTEVERLDAEVKEDKELSVEIEKSVSEVEDVEKEIEIVEEVERLDAEVKENEELPFEIEESVSEVKDIEKEIEIVEKVDTEVERLDAEVKEDVELPIEIEESVSEVEDIVKEIEILEKVDTEIERLDAEVKEDEELPFKIEESVSEVENIEKEIEAKDSEIKVVSEIEKLVPDTEELDKQVEESIVDIQEVENVLTGKREIEKVGIVIDELGIETKEVDLEIEELVTKVEETKSDLVPVTSKHGITSEVTAIVKEVPSIDSVVPVVLVTSDTIHTDNVVEKITDVSEVLAAESGVPVYDVKSDLLTSSGPENMSANVVGSDIMDKLDIINEERKDASSEEYKDISASGIVEIVDEVEHIKAITEEVPIKQVEGLIETSLAEESKIKIPEEKIIESDTLPLVVETLEIQDTDIKLSKEASEVDDEQQISDFKIPGPDDKITEKEILGMDVTESVPEDVIIKKGIEQIILGPQSKHVDELDIILEKEPILSEKAQVVVKEAVYDEKKELVPQIVEKLSGEIPAREIIRREKLDTTVTIPEANSTDVVESKISDVTKEEREKIKGPEKFLLAIDAVTGDKGLKQSTSKTLSREQPEKEVSLFDAVSSSQVPKKEVAEDRKRPALEVLEPEDKDKFLPTEIIPVHEISDKLPRIKSANLEEIITGKDKEKVLEVGKTPERDYKEEKAIAPLVSETLDGEFPSIVSKEEEHKKESVPEVFSVPKKDLVEKESLFIDEDVVIEKGDDFEIVIDTKGGESEAPAAVDELGVKEGDDIQVDLDTKGDVSEIPVIVEEVSTEKDDAILVPFDTESCVSEIPVVVDIEEVVVEKVDDIALEYPVVIEKSNTIEIISSEIEVVSVPVEEHTELPSAFAQESKSVIEIFDNEEMKDKLPDTEISKIREDTYKIPVEKKSFELERETEKKPIQVEIEEVVEGPHKTSEQKLFKEIKSDSEFVTKELVKEMITESIDDTVKVKELEDDKEKLKRKPKVMADDWKSEKISVVKSDVKPLLPQEAKNIDEKTSEYLKSEERKEVVKKVVDYETFKEKSKETIETKEFHLSLLDEREIIKTEPGELKEEKEEEGELEQREEEEEIELIQDMEKAGGRDKVLFSTEEPKKRTEKQIKKEIPKKVGKEIKIVEKKIETPTIERFVPKEISVSPPLSDVIKPKKSSSVILTKSMDMIKDEKEMLKDEDKLSDKIKESSKSLTQITLELFNDVPIVKQQELQKKKCQCRKIVKKCQCRKRGYGTESIGEHHKASKKIYDSNNPPEKLSLMNKYRKYGIEVLTMNELHTLHEEVIKRVCDILGDRPRSPENYNESEIGKEIKTLSFEELALLHEKISITGKDKFLRKNPGVKYPSSLTEFSPLGR